MESTAVEEHPSEPLPAAGPAPSTALERRPFTNEVIKPLDAAEVKQAMISHQELLRQILDRSDWQGEPDQQGSFVKKSGWRKIALAYNLDVTRVGEEVERDDEGVPQRASYTARATAPNGRAMEATGHCAFAESRFSGNRGNTSKLENDMRATAETRAKNRAISDLIGMGKVSAEEVDAGASGAPAGPAYGKPASAAEEVAAGQAVAYLCDVGRGPDGELADFILTDLKKRLAIDAGLSDPYLPQVVTYALRKTAGELKKKIDALNSPAANDPAPPAGGEQIVDAQVVAEDEANPELQNELAAAFREDAPAQPAAQPGAPEREEFGY